MKNQMFTDKNLVPTSKNSLKENATQIVDCQHLCKKT